MEKSIMVEGREREEVSQGLWRRDYICKVLLMFGCGRRGVGNGIR